MEAPHTGTRCSWQKCIPVFNNSHNPKCTHTLTDIPVSCDLEVSGNCTLTTVSTLWHIFNSLALDAWPLWVATGNRVHTSCWHMCQQYTHWARSPAPLGVGDICEPVTVPVTVTQMVTTCCQCQVDLALSQSTAYVYQAALVPSLIYHIIKHTAHSSKR